MLDMQTNSARCYGKCLGMAQANLRDKCIGTLVGFSFSQSRYSGICHARDFVSTRVQRVYCLASYFNFATQRYRGFSQFNACNKRVTTKQDKGSVKQYQVSSRIKQTTPWIFALREVSPRLLQ